MAAEDVRALVNLRPSELTYASDPDLQRQLGVIKPGAKWPELASIDNRLRTFVQAGDPVTRPVSTQALCNAGFFCQVSSGAVICFCCGGALRDWQDDDNPWVEHARHFPECGYLQLKKGPLFVDAVQKLAKDGKIQKITQEMVCAEVGQSPVEFELSRDPFRQNSAVLTLVDYGYDLKDVLHAAHEITRQGKDLTVSSLFTTLDRSGKQRPPSLSNANLDVNEDNEQMAQTRRSLEEQNKEMREMTLCGICRVRNRSVVYLPCGHLYCCVDCGGTRFARCPVCRQQIEGIVRRT